MVGYRGGYPIRLKGAVIYFFTNGYLRLFCFFVVPFAFLLFSFFELCRFDAKPKVLEAKLNSLEAEPCVVDVVVPNRVNDVDGILKEEREYVEHIGKNMVA